MAVDLKHVIELLDGGSWVQLALVKANEKKGMAGEILRFAKCRIARRSQTPKALMQEPAISEAGNKRKKNPHHQWNFTRNIEDAHGRIVTIHPLFIFEINGKAVI